MQAKARQVAELYARRDVERFGPPWNASELVLGFLGDVGDLAKLTQAKVGVRPHDEVDKALEHELADCLWSLIVIADAFEIDLESAFRRTMGELSDQLRDDSEREGGPYRVPVFRADPLPGTDHGRLNELTDELDDEALLEKLTP